ncbi:flavocytochrome c [Shewanella abyssi]|uniref:flavocytochrome c n=1 Tax=Shewanella abyssi TaxID=311789 RepID=UPI00200F9B88|nr:flavocytochrome c [Shewanella abyssi]MCL1051311.1 flavocytochrome c [Shewanella abyssi]
MKRREFLTKTMGATAAMTLPFSVSSKEPEHKWDREYDLIIVGSGFTGVAAAYSAYKAGLKNILVLEKMKVWGGNSVISGGLAGMPNSKLQKKLGIKDSPELLVKDMLKAGRNFNNPELAYIMASQAYTVYDMLIDCGAQFKDKLIRSGGHSAARSHIPKNASGGGLVVPMHKYLLAHGVKFQNRTKVSNLIQESDLSISGVAVQEDYDFDTKKFKRESTYKSRHGIVVATGGWTQDKKFISTTMPMYSDLERTAHPGATSEMIKSLLAVGSLPLNFDMYQLGPWGCPDEIGGGPASFFAGYAFNESIAVDPMTGQRFVDEHSSRRTRSEAEMLVMEKGTKEKPNYPITFSSEDTAFRAEGFDAAFRDGSVQKTNSVAELAELYGMDVNKLTQSIADWNEVLKGNMPDPFGKTIDKRTELKAPYYSMRLSPKLHYCMGGIAINKNAEVISADTCEPIKGLFAGGEVAAGTHGMDRLGGCSSVDCMVFGQIAGRTAAKYKANA